MVAYMLQIFLVLSIDKPKFNSKGYCETYCPYGSRKSPHYYYCCDSDHRMGNEPKNLYQAALHKDVNWVKYFLEKGEFVNQINTEELSNTPLHNAVVNENIEIAKTLLKNGANINAVGDNKMTPLHVASLYNNLEFIKLALKYGANINLRDNKNKTPLHNAVIKKNCKMVDYLLSNGAEYYAKFRLHGNYGPYYNAYEYTYNVMPSTGCLNTLIKHNPVDKWLLDNNFELTEYKPIIERLGINKLSDIDNFKGKTKSELFSPIEWSLNYNWLPTSFPCTPNCTQHKINLVRLINN